jgi:hypothetical protein
VDEDADIDGRVPELKLLNCCSSAKLDRSCLTDDACGSTGVGGAIESLLLCCFAPLTGFEDERSCAETVRLLESGFAKLKLGMAEESRLI